MSSLAWVKGSNYHIKSECGRYTVAKTGRDNYIRYSAWLKFGDWQSKTLGVFLESSEAKAACQQHADLQKQEVV